MWWDGRKLSEPVEQMDLGQTEGKQLCTNEGALCLEYEPSLVRLQVKIETKEQPITITTTLLNNLSKIFNQRLLTTQDYFNNKNASHIFLKKTKKQKKNNNNQS